MRQKSQPNGCEWQQNGPCGAPVKATLVDDRKNGLGRMDVCDKHYQIWKNKEQFEFEVMTDNTTSESIDTDDQSRSLRVKTATEFFSEKFAEEETESVWIDLKDETVNGLRSDE